jgi:large subunit ribosomal protein L30e
MTDIEEIKKNLKTTKLSIGTDETLKQLKLGKIARVFMASNCSDSTKKDLEYYCGLGSVELIKLDLPKDELGILCKKQFSIAVLSLLK